MRYCPIFHNAALILFEISSRERRIFK